MKLALPTAAQPKVLQTHTAQTLLYPQHEEEQRSAAGAGASIFWD